MKLTSDMEIRKKGLNVLFRELGEVDAIRFLSQISCDKRDYLSLQEELLKGMSVDKIKAKALSYRLQVSVTQPFKG